MPRVGAACCVSHRPWRLLRRYQRAGGVFPYAECAAFQAAARGNHTGDAVPYLANVIAGFDPRPWHEAIGGFEPPSASEWELALRLAKKQVEAPGANMGFPDLSQPGGVRPAFNIYAFNEYGEGGILAPTAGDGFMKLGTVAKVMGRA